MQSDTQPIDQSSFTPDEKALWDAKYKFYREVLAFDEQTAIKEADELIKIDRVSEQEMISMKVWVGPPVFSS